jgi:hypothetical protein
MILSIQEAHGHGHGEHDDENDEQDVGCPIAPFNAFGLGFGKHSGDEEYQAQDDDQFEEYAHGVLYPILP